MRGSGNSSTCSTPIPFLKKGDNVIAIHVINATKGSSDLSIDAVLLVPPPPAPTPSPTPGKRILSLPQMHHRKFGRLPPPEATYLKPTLSDHGKDNGSRRSSDGSITLSGGGPGGNISQPIFHCPTRNYSRIPINRSSPILF
ncbi:MAG: hypothetical protein CM1200mP29_03140 [Verrucomicrobiota bacterium]|nr:MAG: hypothetical protein CM1200mP29_03140 [Verrucomicrobiota bacterium]